MNKQQIHNLINDKHEALISFLDTHDDQKWNKGPEGKWTTGQHVVHLTQSATAMNRGLGFPKIMLQYKFGKANRPARSYDEVTENYYNKMAKLDGPIVSPVSKQMPDTPVSSKRQFIINLTTQKNLLLKRLNKLSEKQLDKYLLPHPLMGRMLLREVLMWSAFHVEHHHKILLKRY